MPISSILPDIELVPEQPKVVRNHSTKENHNEAPQRGKKIRPPSPQTKRMLNAALDRAGDPAYPDHKPSNKLHEQSAGAKRQGDNTYLGYPDARASQDDSASTGHDGSGSKRGTRG